MPLLELVDYSNVRKDSLKSKDRKPFDLMDLSTSELLVFFVWHDVDSNVTLKFLTPSIIVVATWVGLLNMVPLYQIA
jgi:hypothetical protein